MPKQETVAALQSSDIVGHYECLLYTGDAKNDWHYVTITEEAPNVFLWSNRAGVTWKLFQDLANPTHFTVGPECPYYDWNHRNEADF